MSNFDSRNYFGLLVYVATGVLQPIIIDYLRLHNLLGSKFLLLPTLANVLGMASCGLLASSVTWSNFKTVFRSNAKLRRMIFITASVDLLSGMLLTGGLLLTGGQIFVVLYNSCPAWTALLSRFVLKKMLTATQLLGVILVCSGLILNVVSSQMQLSENESKDNDTNLDQVQVGNTQSFLVVIGSITVLLGSLLHSLMFVLSDMSMSTVHQYEEDRSHQENYSSSHAKRNLNSSMSVTGEVWSCCLGSIESIFMLLWVSGGMLIYGFQDASESDIETNTIPWNKAIFGFVALVFVDAVHAGAFFTLLKNLGAVASALLKGVQAIVVIALSSILYCPTEASQCLTLMKAVSAIVVLTGVIMYGGGRQLKQKKEEIEPIVNSDIYRADSCSFDCESRAGSRSQLS